MPRRWAPSGSHGKDVAAPEKTAECRGRVARLQAGGGSLTEASSDKRIGERAYFMWKAAGEPSGRDREFWEQAERSLAAEASQMEAQSASIQTAVELDTAGPTAEEQPQQHSLFGKLLALLNAKHRVKAYLGRQARKDCGDALRSWYKAEFIARAERKEHARQFWLVILFVYRYRTISDRIALFWLAPMIVLALAYNAIVVYEFPKHSLMDNGLIVTLDVNKLITNRMLLRIFAYGVFVSVIFSLGIIVIPLRELQYQWRR